MTVQDILSNIEDFYNSDQGFFVTVVTVFTIINVSLSITALTNASKQIQ